jgi:hypothetical protein
MARRTGSPPQRAWAAGWLVFAVVDTVLGDIHGVPILAGAALGLALGRDLPAPAALSR